MIRVHQITKSNWETTENATQILQPGADQRLWVELLDPTQEEYKQAVEKLGVDSTELWIGTGYTLPKLLSNLDTLGIVLNKSGAEVIIRYHSEKTGWYSRIVLFQNPRYLLTISSSPFIPWILEQSHWRSGPNTPDALASITSRLAFHIVRSCSDFSGPISVLQDMASSVSLEAVRPDAVTLRFLEELQTKLLHTQWILRRQTEALQMVGDREHDREIWKEVLRYIPRLKDHVRLISEMRSDVADARDMCLALLNFRASETMKVLALVTAVLLPFIVIPGLWAVVTPFIGKETATVGRNWMWAMLAALALSPLLLFGGFWLWLKKKGWWN